MTATAPVTVTVAEAVLGALRAEPAGLTAREISQKTGIVLNTVSPRTAPLQRAGLIESTGQRRGGQTVWKIK